MINKASPMIAFIGVGNMGSAIVKGLISSNSVDQGNIIIFDKFKAKYNNFSNLLIKKAETIKDALIADYVFIAVKPGDVKQICGDIRDSGIDIKNKVFVSICAGVPTGYICKCLGADLPVIRMMPSTPLLVGSGAVAISCNSQTTQQQFQYICRIISNVAEVVKLDESKMNDVIAVNGSSPAYVYIFIKAMLDAAVESGIQPDAALPLILKTIEGSCKMVIKSGKDIDTLIKEVISPNGTTAKSVEVFENHDFTGIIKQAMDACTKRADEITEEICSE